LLLRFEKVLVTDVLEIRFENLFEDLADPLTDVETSVILDGGIGRGPEGGASISGRAMEYRTREEFEPSVSFDSHRDEDGKEPAGSTSSTSSGACVSEFTALSTALPLTRES
jgi:hypothetical protein